MGFSDEWTFWKGNDPGELSDQSIFQKFPDKKIQKKMVNYSVNKHFWWIITIRQITCKRLLDILGIFSVFISFYRAILRRCDTDNFFVKAFKKINKLINELIYKNSLNEEFFKCFSWMSNFLLRIRKTCYGIFWFRYCK